MREPTLLPLPINDLPASSLSRLERLGALEDSRSLLGTVALSASALEAVVSQLEAADRMRVPLALREAIALRVAELNQSTYCLHLHQTRLLRLLGDPTAIGRLRRGISDDPKEQALLSLTTKLLLDKGHHAALAIELAREAGVTNEEIVEVVALVGLCTFTNVLSSLAATPPELSKIGLGGDVDPGEPPSET